MTNFKVFYQEGSQLKQANEGDLGYDIYYNALNGYDILSNPTIVEKENWYGELQLYPQERVMIKTGIHIAFPEGYGGLLKERSSLAKQGLVITGGVIDNSYTGEIRVICANLSGDIITIKHGERFAQLIFTLLTGFEFEVVTSLDDFKQTNRGQNGFGSTGK